MWTSPHLVRCAGLCFYQVLGVVIHLSIQFATIYYGPLTTQLHLFLSPTYSPNPHLPPKQSPTKLPPPALW